MNCIVHVKKRDFLSYNVIVNGTEWAVPMCIMNQIVKCFPLTADAPIYIVFFSLTSFNILILHISTRVGKKNWCMILRYHFS